MRDVSAAQAKLDTQYGTEPIVIVEIQWAVGGQRVLYADREIDPSVRGQIVEIGNIDSAVQADWRSDSNQLSLTLEDTDGAIKAIFDVQDLHKRPVWVHQWFDGLDLADKFLLFKGEINSPVVWNEGDRTVSFDVTTRIEDVEAGFSMEEGDFPIVPPDALGKAWPLVFGSVCDVPAIQVRAPRYGVLAAGEGIHDYTLESRICQAKYISCPNVPAGEENTLTGSAGNYGFAIQQKWEPDTDCVEDRYFTICDLMYQLEQQVAYEHATMTIIGATDLFPQGETITINIEGGKFTGSFSGDVFTIESREHPDYVVNPPGICVAIPPERSYTRTAVFGSKGMVQTESGNTWYDRNFFGGAQEDLGVDPRDLEDYCEEAQQASARSTEVGGASASQKALDDMPTASFFWARAGSKVFLEAEAEVLYIVNLLPCTITRVAALKNTNFGPKLMTVPEDYYTIYETDYDGYTVTEIGMTKPLSQRSTLVEYPSGDKKLESENWQDDLYVTLTSTVGPNPVDIIEWLVNKYTALTVDAVSFTYVHARLANYPSQFALVERKNVMDLIADVAMQSRCVVYVRDDVLYIKYASEEPTSVATITESDVLVNSLTVNLSSTEEVATKHVVTWRRNYEGDLTLILKYNVAKYGTHEKELDYYTQNIYENVLKSATFWMIRDANVWKEVTFSTPLKYLALEVFDCVTLDLSDVAPAPVKAVITAVNYNIADEQIDFTCWTPLRAGETAPYIHAWPADIAAGTIFPTAEERALGLGYTFTVTPPVGHLLYVDQPDDGNIPPVLSSGDEHPSDLDDALLACFCPTTDDAIFDERDPTFESLKRAQKSSQTATRNAQNAGAGGKNDQKNQEKHACGAPTDSGFCVYETRVQYVTPHLVHTCKQPSGWGCSCTSINTPGFVCTGTLSTFCHAHGAPFGAWLFYTQKLAEAKANQCNFSCGVTAVYSVSKPKGIEGGGAFGECEELPGDPSAPNQAEIAEPGELT